MKKSMLVILFVCLLLSPVQVSAASRNDLSNRISYHHDECFIVRDDGTVFMNTAAKERFPEVSAWSDIMAISSYIDTVLGLKTDETVVAVSDRETERTNVSDWKDIVEIQADIWCSYGLTSDGSLVYAGELLKSQQEVFDTYSWTGLKHITADYELFAVTNDGKILSTVDEDFSKIQNIQNVSAGDMEASFLLDDGNYICYSTYVYDFINGFDWPSIVQITYDNGNRAGLSDNGKVYGAPITSSVNGKPWRGYADLDLINIVAISGGAAVDKDGVIHFTREVETDEEIPTFDMERYKFDETDD